MMRLPARFRRSAAAFAALAFSGVAAPAPAQADFLSNLFGGGQRLDYDTSRAEKTGSGDNAYRGEVDRQKLETDLRRSGFYLGQPVHIRIFKQASATRKGPYLEVWFQMRDGTFKKYKSFAVIAMSGELGPKLKQGDYQAPEGFYNVTPGLLNPNSGYQISFNLGYPNKFDRAHGRTGSAIMVHGASNQNGLFSSAGCFAIREVHDVYEIARAALNNGQRSFPVHVFPFPMTDANMRRHAGSKWASFWQQLKPAYDSFERTKRVASVAVEGRRYVVNGVVPAVQTSGTALAYAEPKKRAEPVKSAAVPVQTIPVKEIPIPTRNPRRVAAEQAARRIAETFAQLESLPKQTLDLSKHEACLIDGRWQLRKISTGPKTHSLRVVCRLIQQ